MMFGLPLSRDKRLSLDDGVRVWAVRLNDAGFDLANSQRILSVDEQARAVRFKFARDQRRYLVAHAAVRSILAQYLEVSPEELQFVNEANGKPKLAPTFAPSG